MACGFLKFGDAKEERQGEWGLGATGFVVSRVVRFGNPPVARFGFIRMSAGAVGGGGLAAENRTRGMKVRSPKFLGPVKIYFCRAFSFQPESSRRDTPVGIV